MDAEKQIIRGYELQQRIGAGGFGEVYRAYQTQVEREVAIKVIRPEYINHPDFIRRFEVEARVIARLEHIHIVPLYDYWREAAGAYLVMRWLPGNLRKSLRRGALPLESVTRWLDQIASGLAVAHRHGVIHRDIKPDNILLDDENNAYLADFGIAKDLTAADGDDESSLAGMLVGSPAYLSPEQIIDNEIGPQTDIYCLGITLYELLTGSLPFATTDTSTLFNMQLTEQLPDLQTKRPDLNEALNAVLRRATQKNPLDRYADAAAFYYEFRQGAENIHLEALPAEPGQVVDNPTVVLVPDKRSTSSNTMIKTLAPAISPYKGLRAFEEADAADFFGRKALTAELLARLSEADPLARFLAVVGPSGSGKSSVVHAGLIPAIRRGGLPGSQEWYIAEIIPGTQPLNSLVSALLSVAVDPPANLQEQLNLDRGGLSRMVKEVLPHKESDQFVLVINQFEEVFTLSESEDDRRLFLESIFTAVTDPASQLRVIITLRADFYDRPLLYNEFGELLRQRTEVVLPLSIPELTDAIIRPAERVGLTVEAELVTAIVADVGQQPGTLPLLQYALTELYEHRTEKSLTLDAYRATGGVLGALALRADELYNDLDAANQSVARQLFLRLVSLGEGAEDTRRRIQRAELTSIGDADAFNLVIETYSKYRLLTTDIDPLTRAPTLELAHEALIRTWDRLHNWLDSDRQEIRVHRQLMDEVKEWELAGKDADYLAVGTRLDQFEALMTSGSLALNQDERGYVEASRSAEQARSSQDAFFKAQRAEQAVRTAHLAREAELAERRATNRLHYLLVVLTVSLIGALILSAGALIAKQDADRQRSEAVQAKDAADIQRAAAVQAKQDADEQRTAAEQARDVAVAQQDIARQNAARSEASLAQADALRLAAESTNVLDNDDGELATLLALRSLKDSSSLQADAALQLALSKNYVQQIYEGTGSPIGSVAYSPDEKLLLTAGSEMNDSKLRIWDAASGKVMLLIDTQQGGLNSAVFSPDGSQLLAGAKDGSARLWDAKTGKAVEQFLGHSEAVTSVAFSPDGKLVLTGSEDKTARLWDAQTGKEIRQFLGHSGPVNSVSFSPDGTQALTASLDGTVRRWDIGQGALLGAYREPTQSDRFYSAAFSPDGRQIAAGGFGEVVFIWDTDSAALANVLKGHSDIIHSVAFSPDGAFLVSGSDDRSAIVWDLKQGTPIRRYMGHTNTVNHVQFTHNGDYILTSSEDGDVRLWSRDEISAPDPFPHLIAGHTGPVYSVAVSPDGNWLASGSKDGIARIWDAKTGVQVKEFEGHQARIWVVAFSPDGKQLLTGSDDKMAILWDIASGSKSCTFKHDGTVWAVAFSQDGKRIVTGSGDDETGQADNSARLWDAQNCSLVHQYKDDKGGEVYGVAITPDGKSLVTVSKDGKGLVWDVEKATPSLPFIEKADQIFNVAISPDGTQILIGKRDGTAQLWDLHGKLIRTFSGHTDVVWNVAFSPDGKYILTASQDRTARLWDKDSGVELRRITGHPATVTSVAFIPNSDLVVDSSYDGTLRIATRNRDALVAFACARLKRDFSDRERTQFGIPKDVATCPAK